MKAKKIITIVFTVLAAFMPVMSGIVKLTKSMGIVERMNAAHVGQYITILGIMELVFAALFLYPKTMKIGFLLLTCYFAGAMGTELANGADFNAVLPMVLLWIAAFLRDREIFLPSSKVRV
jgi:hypothetical protein